MKCPIARIATLAMLVAWGVGVVWAQDSPGSESLADLARQAKAQRAKSRDKTKVYTNEDVEALPRLPMSTTEIRPGEPTAQATTGNKAGNDSLKARPAEAGGERHGEEYFRARMGKLEERLELDQREVTIFQQTLGQNQMLYYSDPVQGLLQSSGPTAMSDIHSQQDLIAKTNCAARVAIQAGFVMSLLGSRGQARQSSPDPRARKTGRLDSRWRAPG